jgi:uncharacterized RDD family membrane protein YckC
MHWRAAGLANLFWLAVAGVAYHFVLEARDGQTIGKRRHGIRVVAAGGGPASPGAIAIRSVLRMVDSLPVCYVSGFAVVVSALTVISMAATGSQPLDRVQSSQSTPAGADSAHSLTAVP